MPFTEAELDERIRQLQDGIDSVSEVQFEGEMTKYRGVKEIERGILYFQKMKSNLMAPAKKRKRFSPIHMTIDRGL